MKVVDSLLSESKDLKFVKAVFWPNTVSSYTYKTCLDVAVDDFAVVKVKNEYKVVRIVSVHAFEEVMHTIDYNAYSIKWLVQRVDFSEFDHCVQNEAEIVEELKKAKSSAERKTLIKELKEEIGSAAVKKTN